jgi:hypothetical protein
MRGAAAKTGVELVSCQSGDDSDRVHRIDAAGARRAQVTANKRAARARSRSLIGSVAAPDIGGFGMHSPPVAGARNPAETAQ